MPCYNPHNESVSGEAYSVMPNDTVSLELMIPYANPEEYPNLYKILIGVNFICGGWDKTFDWELRNKTDNKPIDSGTITIQGDQEDLPPICSELRRFLSDKIELVQSSCVNKFGSDNRFALRRRYWITEEWRGKTIEFKIVCKTTYTVIIIHARVCASVNK